MNMDDIRTRLLNAIAFNRTLIRQQLKEMEEFITQNLHLVQYDFIKTFATEDEDERMEGLEVGIFVPKRDVEYYKPIPENCTKEALVDIMAHGIVSYQSDQKGMTGKKERLKQIADVLDTWFEHDANTDNLFSDLVDDDEFEQFEKDVLNRARQIRRETLEELRKRA